jgi:hypothetical protein
MKRRIIVRETVDTADIDVTGRVEGLTSGSGAPFFQI